MSAHPQHSTAIDDVTPEWLEGHLATVFSRWHPQVVHLLRATSDAIIAAAEVRPGDAVLDVGSGSGIPALAVAELVGPSGRVVATDPSPIFLAALSDNVRAGGLDNVEVVQASAAGLPFDTGRFDAATCHMGVMFFPDVQAGLTRIRDLVKPGGRAAFVAWGSDADNSFMATLAGASRPHLPPEPPASGLPPDPDAPRPTRFAEPGSLSAALTAAGYADVREDAPMVDLVWPEGPASLTHFWLELTRLEQRVAPERHAALRADIEAAYERYRDGNTVRMPVRVVAASGAA